MKTQHTPGPWHVDEEDPTSNDVYCRSGELLATAYEMKKVSTLVGTANARLIAAAPELLEALEKLVAATEKCDNAGDMGVDTGSEEMKGARATIKEARGL